MPSRIIRVKFYSFSPFRAGKEKSPLPFWVYPKKGFYLGWIDLNPIQSSSQPISRESVSINLSPGGIFVARYVLLVDIEVFGSGTLFPVVQRRLRNAGPSPYALTNPIFVDVDGNGKFDSPLPKIMLIY